MATIVTRAGKGSPLTNNEVDNNFVNLNNDKVETSAIGTIASQNANNVAITGGAISGATLTASDALFTLQDDADVTKQARFQLSGIATGTTVIYTLPTGSAGASTLVDLATAQTINGTKTFSGIVTFSGATQTFGSSTATGTTSIGTGATLSGSTRTINIGNAGVAGSTTAITIGGTANTTNVTANGNWTYANTITGSITGNAGTVTNGVYTNGSYADPAWITSLAGSKVTGNISGSAANVTGTVAIANGGTGATDAATARTNLGLAIGTDVQAYSANLTTIAGLTPTNDNFIVGTGTAWALETPAQARTSLGGTTVGQNFFTLANPTAVTFPRINADNTVSALDAATFRTAIGAGTSSTTGTVTSVSGTGTVSGLTLTGTVTSSGSLTLGGTLAVTASNFASQTANTFLAAPNGIAGTPTFRAIVAADIPTLNQNTTGTASNVTGTVAIANGGTGATTAAGALTNLGAYAATNPNGYTSNTGTVTSIVAGTGLSGGTITTSGTIALANTTVTAGSYTTANITVDAQGRITAASSGSGGVTSITGTASQITASASTGAVTLSLPATINVNTSGNAATVTDGVYASTTQTISGAKTLSSSSNRIGAFYLGTNDTYIYESATNEFTVRTGASGAYKYVTVTAAGNMTTGGNITASGNITANSDERLKTNVQTISNALAKVESVRGVTYNRKSDGSAGIGVIAQEIQKVAPEAVIVDEEGMMSVAYGNLVGLLIEAVKELSAEVKELKQKVGE